MQSATSTKQDQHDYSMWTPAFDQLHAAVLAGASREEIQRLEAAELDELQ